MPRPPTVANRQQTKLGDACSRHRSPIRGDSDSLPSDSTLQKGDAATTPKGFVVFQRAKTCSIKCSGFVALSQARSLPRSLRAMPVDLERAGASRRQVGAHSSPGASAR
jgi:hypothetical protein